MAINTNELAAAVKQYIDPAVSDGLAVAAPLWKHFTEDGKEKLDGGLTIQFILKGIANQAQGFIAGTGALTDLSSSQQLVYGTLNWKYYNFNVNFTIQDFTIAKGSKEQAADFFVKKTEGALADSFRQLAQAAHGSSSSAPLQFEGLRDIVAASGTTYAGLLDTDYATAVYLPYIQTGTTLNYAIINDMITTLRSRTQTGTVDPKKMMGLMNPKTYARMMNILQNQQVFFDVKDVAEAGFDGFRINGCDFFMDYYVPGTQDGSTNDNYVYVFMKDAIKFFYKYGFGATSPLDGDVQPANQPIKSIQHYIAGNIVCTDRRLVAVNKTVIA